MPTSRQRRKETNARENARQRPKKIKRWAEPWRPKPDQRAFLEVFLKEPHTPPEDICVAIGCVAHQFKVWRADPEFMRWLNSEVSAVQRAQRYQAHQILLDIMEDPEVQARDKIQAARTFLQEVPADTAGRGSVLKGLFDKLGTLKDGTTLDAAHVDEEGNRTAIRVQKKSPEQEEIEDFLSKSQDLGVTETTPTNPIEKAAKEALQHVQVLNHLDTKPKEKKPRVWTRFKDRGIEYEPCPHCAVWSAVDAETMTAQCALCKTEFEVADPPNIHSRQGQWGPPAKDCRHGAKLLAQCASCHRKRVNDVDRTGEPRAFQDMPTEEDD